MKRLAAGLILLFFCTPAQARDWKKHPAVAELDAAVDIFAVGDPHSDFERLADVLAAAKLIAGRPSEPDQVVWTGGKVALVITGDTIDKGPSGLRVLAFIGKLQNVAAAKGGVVILTMGNHEAEFLADPTGKKSKDFREELRAIKLDPAHVAACGGPLGEFLCNLPIAVRINDWFFSHGGNTGGQSIVQLNATIEEAVSRNGFGVKELIGPNSILEARLNGEGPAGLPWIYDGDKQTDPQKLLAKYAEKVGVRHFVQGHQPAKVEFLDGVTRNAYDLFQRWGLLFLMDTGMSRGIGDSTSIGGALHISSNASGSTVEGICANGQRTILWDSATNPPMNAIHCGK
jgi:hypothetical protein